MKRKQGKYILTALLLCLLPVLLPAQEVFIIHGKVSDQETKLPVRGVNIRVQNSYTGTSTDDRGMFELRVSKLPAVLLATHIAYFGKPFIVTQKLADSVFIFLSPKAVELDEAEITAGKYKIFTGKHMEVIDYSFMDTSLLILAYDFNKNRHELILTDTHFDTLGIKDVSYLKKPGQLFKDCMGNCQLLTWDSAYQVYFTNGSIKLIYPTYWEKFYSLLANCLFETQTHLAFKENSRKQKKADYAALTLSDLSNPRDLTGKDEWQHQFFLVDKTTHKKTILDAVSEWEKKRDAYDHAMFIFTDNELTHRSFGDILRFAEIAYFRPAFQTLKLLNDTIYYFNHLRSRIDVYADNLVLIDSITIDYHNRKNWKEIIITDKIKNKAYTVFSAGAKFVLAEINLHDGTVREITRIDKLFPTKIRVNDGYLYFLYNDLHNAWGTRQLFQGELVNN